LPRSSIDSNSGGDTRRPVRATRGGP
jgi:hypothetical protein